jgi:hypothetical protein
MDNEDVIEKLKAIIQELTSRLNELQALQGAPGGPLGERADRQMQIFARISSINIRVLHLQNRLADRQLAESVAGLVTPLSPERRDAMEAALKTVSKSIAAVADFQSAIALAEQISSAGSSAANASAVT